MTAKEIHTGHASISLFSAKHLDHPPLNLPGGIIQRRFRFSRERVGYTFFGPLNGKGSSLMITADEKTRLLVIDVRLVGTGTKHQLDKRARARVKRIKDRYW